MKSESWHHESVRPGRKRVFLSYTTEFRDFPVAGRTFVQAARDALRDYGFEWVDMDDFSPDKLPSADVCIERVRDCELWIGIIGFRYGDQPVDGRSYVQVEYDAAAMLDRRVFLWETIDTSLIPFEKIDQAGLLDRQKAFRARLQSEVTSKSFSTPDRLAYLMALALRSVAAPAMPNWFEAVETNETGRLPPEALDLSLGSESSLAGLPDACRRALRLLGHLERRAELPVGIEGWPAADQIAVARRTVLSMIPMTDKLSDVLVNIETQVQDSDAVLAQALVERPKLFSDPVVEIHDQLSLTLSRLRTLAAELGARQTRDWAPLRAQLKDMVDRLTSTEDVTITWVTAATQRRQ